MRKPFFTAISSILTLFFVAAFGFSGWAQEPAEGLGSEPKKFDAKEVIFEHVLDAPNWHLTDHLVVPLVVIVYSSEKGLDVFSSGHFFDEHHHPVEYKGYKLAGKNIVLAGTGEKVLNLSITKNVTMLFITAVTLLSVFLSVANSYKKNPGKAPKGLQSFIEPVIIFVRDEIAKPNIGPHYERYLPYILTLFFFVLFGNLLGLLPGSANLTGNIAVTFCLAILTFLITNFSGNRAYWKHIFWTPGVPTILRIIILPVEVIGIFTKPFALTIRLFVAITAGHIVILSLICLGFIFESYFVGIGASLVVVFINLIELLVAGIQAYVFALFTSLYIGMATAEHDHH